MDFYKSVFGGELTVGTFGEFGSSSGPADENLVMHAQLETPSGYTIMASDTPEGMTHREGSSITVSLSGDDGDELRRFWDGLAGLGGHAGHVTEGHHVQLAAEDRLVELHRLAGAVAEAEVRVQEDAHPASVSKPGPAFLKWG
jgi:hypothetical protein